MTNPYIEVNEWLPTTGTGHTNLSFYSANGTLLMTVGANINDDGNILNGIQGGIYNETTSHTNPDHRTRFYMDPTAFSNLYSEAQADITGDDQDWDFVGKNCVDYVHEKLNSAGIQHDLWSLFNGPYLSAYGGIKDMINNWGAIVDDFWNTGGSDNNWFKMDWYFEQSVFGQGGFLTSVHWEEFPELEEQIRESPYSPIVIDLDGDGIETTRMKYNPEDAVFFDIDGNGTQDRLGWLSGDDAFLVRDLNGDGLINSGLEMFGGAERGIGYAELSELDGNSDGILNSNDAEFASLLLWQDANANGITDEGELISTSSADLTEIELNYQNLDIEQRGNLLGESSRVWINGVEQLAVDVYFQADLDYAA